MIFLFGERIKKLRRERKLTIEEVSEKIGVTRKKLYQWEISDGYPDTKKLEAIAEFFGIPMSYLTDVKHISDEEKYNDINNEWEENNANGNHSENFTLMLVGLKYFQNDVRFTKQLVTTMESMDLPEEEKQEKLRKSIDILLEMISNSTDETLKYETYAHIANIYIKLGEQDNAITYAEKLPSNCYSKEAILSLIHQ